MREKRRRKKRRLAVLILQKNVRRKGRKKGRIKGSMTDFLVNKKSPPQQETEGLIKKHNKKQSMGDTKTQPQI